MLWLASFPIRPTTIRRGFQYKRFENSIFYLVWHRTDSTSAISLYSRAKRFKSHDINFHIPDICFNHFQCRIIWNIFKRYYILYHKCKGSIIWRRHSPRDYGKLVVSRLSREVLTQSMFNLYIKLSNNVSSKSSFILATLRSSYYSFYFPFSSFDPTFFSSSFFFGLLQCISLPGYLDYHKSDFWAKRYRTQN